MYLSFTHRQRSFSIVIVTFVITAALASGGVLKGFTSRQESQGSDFRKGCASCCECNKVA